MRTNKHIVRGAIFALLILLAGCSNRQMRQPGWVFFPVEIRERSGQVDISQFPQTIDFFFYASNFSPESAALSEIVGEQSDFIPFYAKRIAPDSIVTVVFIEDCSGSMLENIPAANSMIHSAVRSLPDSKIGLIRIGKNAVWAQKPIDAEQFYYLYLDSLPYPKPNGTSLEKGLQLAADDEKISPSLIVLLADGSISATQKLTRVIADISKLKIPIVAIQMDGENSCVLRDIAISTDGYFASARENSIEEIVLGGWLIKYSPAVKDTNGAEHRVLLRWGSHRRIAKYSAPGTFNPKNIEVKQMPLPSELIAGIRIPFIMPDNASPISITETALDSLVELIDNAHLPEGAILRIDGYTCNLGSRKHNYDLSLRRAKVVANYVRQHAKTPIDFDIRGHGEKDPLMPNISEQNRMANRRAEARIILPPIEIRVQK